MIKFGTGGWRAIIGEEFTKENIQKLALAMALKMKAEHVEDKEGHKAQKGSVQFLSLQQGVGMKHTTPGICTIYKPY